jgi:hypothetical protein
LPVAYQTQAVWDEVAGPSGYPGSWGGHAVPIVDYNETGPIVVSWGKKIQITWAACSKYVDEAYALLSPDIFDGLKSISGFDLGTLQEDLKRIAT